MEQRYFEERLRVSRPDSSNREEHQLDAAPPSRGVQTFTDGQVTGASSDDTAGDEELARRMQAEFDREEPLSERTFLERPSTPHTTGSETGVGDEGSRPPLEGVHEDGPDFRLRVTHIGRPL